MVQPRCPATDKWRRRGTPHTMKRPSVLFIRKWEYFATRDNTNELWGHYANWNVRQRKTSTRWSCVHVDSRKEVRGMAEVSREQNESALKAHTSSMRSINARNAMHTIMTTVNTAMWYMGKILRGWILRVLITRNLFFLFCFLFSFIWYLYEIMNGW